MPLDVDMSAWSSIAHGIHAQALPGVNLHAASCNSLSSFVNKLTVDGLDHLVVVTTVQMPANQLLAIPGESNFKIILDRGCKVLDGLELLFSVSQNVFPQWHVQWNFEGGQGVDEIEEEEEGGLGDGAEAQADQVPAAAANAANLLQGVDINQAIQEYLAIAQVHGQPPPNPQQVQAALHVLQAMGQGGNPHAGQEMRTRVICIAFHRKSPDEQQV